MDYTKPLSSYKAKPLKQYDKEIKPSFAPCLPSKACVKTRTWAKTIMLERNAFVMQANKIRNARVTMHESLNKDKGLQEITLTRRGRINGKLTLFNGKIIAKETF